MIVLHEGRIVYADAESLLTSWSVAKSITSMLIGIALDEGRIRCLENPIVRYLPELAESAYRGVTIEQALQMSSGVPWKRKTLRRHPTSDIRHRAPLLPRVSTGLGAVHPFAPQGYTRLIGGDP